MLERIAPHLAMIGIHKNGTWAAQKVIECVMTPEEVALIAQHLRPYTPPLLLPIPSTPTTRSNNIAQSSHSGGLSGSIDLPLPSAPYAQPLPAYSQLYDENGDRKVDYNTPLPVYTPLPRNGDSKLLPLSSNADEP